MKITKDEITRENIVNAINIDDFTFETLLHKQKADEELTRDENYQIEKHIYKKKWIVEDITPEFIDRHYRKTHIIDNNFIINEDKETLLNTEYFKQFKYDKIDKIKELINHLGFKILNYKIDKTNDINQETFKQKIKDFFTSKYNKTLFGINKEVKEKNHLEIVNETLNNYGYIMNKTRCKVKNNEGKFINDLTFDIKFIDIIDEYHKRKPIKKSYLTNYSNLDYMFE